MLIERYATHPLFPHELDVLAHERGLRLLRLPGHRRSDTSWLGDGIGTADLTALVFWIRQSLATRRTEVTGG